MFADPPTETQFYRSMFHLHTVPSLVLDAPSGRIRDLNQAAATFLGREPITLIGQPFTALFSPGNPPDTTAFAETLHAQGHAEDIWMLVSGNDAEAPAQVSARYLSIPNESCYLITLRSPGSASHEANGGQDRGDLKRLYAEINDPLQEILIWIELLGNIRLRKPAERLTQILKQLRGDGFRPPVDTTTPPSSRAFDRRVPCSRNRVLIVDDETNIRNLFNNILRLNVPDLSLDMAENGRTAMHAFEQSHHCLIILDMKMPTMDGNKVLHQLREICRLKCWQPPSVLLCSGYDSHKVAQAMTQSNLRCAFVPKPITKQELIQAVEELLQHHMAS